MFCSTWVPQALRYANTATATHLLLQCTQQLHIEMCMHVEVVHSCWLRACKRWNEISCVRSRLKIDIRVTECVAYDMQCAHCSALPYAGIVPGRPSTQPIRHQVPLVQDTMDANACSCRQMGSSGTYMHDVMVSSRPKLHMLASHVIHAVCQPLLALRVACNNQLAHLNKRNAC